MSRFLRRMGALSASALVQSMAAPILSALRESLQQPEVAGRRTLRKIVRSAASTEYGKSLGLTRHTTPEAFRQRVPLVSYETIVPWIERQMKTGGQVITPGKTLLYEKTSGSGGAAKYIPYNKALKDSFHRMFLLWGQDLSRRHNLQTGRIFASVSPGIHELTASGARINLEDDAEYLSPFLRTALNPFFNLPSDLKKIRDTATYLEALAQTLIDDKHLEIISVWSPSLLLAALQYIDCNRVKLGLFNAPLEHIWPHLKVVSCWGDGSAQSDFHRLQRLFPWCHVQAKGLIATEAPITVPLGKSDLSVPLINDVYLEFETPAGELVALHELETGLDYQLIVTQRGGLLRYRMQDVVQIQGQQDATPCLRLVGKSSLLSDLVGEKLDEAFVRKVIAPLGANATLIPIVGQDVKRYALVVESKAGLSADGVDHQLRESYHYDIARRNGQLAPLTIRPCQDIGRRILTLLNDRGQRLGDIKPRRLIHSPLAPAELDRYFSNKSAMHRVSRQDGSHPS